MMYGARLILELATVTSVVSLGLACCFRPDPECVNASIQMRAWSVPYGIFGVDVSNSIAVAEFSCLKHCWYTFAIIRGYSGGAIDQNAVSNIANARAAGFASVDVYIVPLLTQSATTQANNIVTGLQGSDYDTFWIAVEGTWTGSASQNQQILTQLVAEFQRHNKVVGVYTDETNWNLIMGNGYTLSPSLQLWYREIVESPSFNDFTPFGGWALPYMKQFRKNVQVCGVIVNEDFRD